MTQFMDHNSGAQESEIVQAKMVRVAEAFAEYPGWTGPDFEAERQASEELAEELHEWSRGTRQRNARSARHNLWN